MIKSKFASILVFLLCGPILIGQTLTDVLRYSQFQPAGTARTAAIAGSFGALGGDWGSLLINPAGIADFHKTDFSFGVSLNNSNTDAYLSGDEENLENKLHSAPNLNHIGIVLTGSPSGKWVTSNFAIGLSQSNNFLEEWNYGGSTVGSITERFVELANGNPADQLDPFEGALAWEAFVIDDDNGDGFYNSHIFDADAQVNKSQNIDRTGRLNEINLAWAGNLNRKFNFGVSLNLPITTFTEVKNYSESDPDNELPTFESLVFQEELTTEGRGFNLKLGVVYRLTQSIRLGVAAHTPTRFRFEDFFQNTITYNRVLDPAGTYDFASMVGNFRYTFSTPWKMVGSVGTILNFGRLKGFVNADVEYINYASSSFNLTRFSSNPGDASYETELNGLINSELSGALNTRLGAELALDKWRIRAGVNGEGSPYEVDGFSFIRTIIAGGIGYRKEKFYLDLSVSRFAENDGFVPYAVLSPERIPLVNVDQKITRFLATFGFKI